MVTQFIDLFSMLQNTEKASERLQILNQINVHPYTLITTRQKTTLRRPIFNIKLLIDNELITSYDNTIYETLTALELEEKQVILNRMNQKSEQYLKIFFFHKTFFHNTKNQKVQISLDIGKEKIKNIYIEIKKVSITNLEDMYLSKDFSNRFLPYFETVLSPITNSNIIYLPFTNKCTMIIISVLDDNNNKITIDNIKKINLILDNVESSEKELQQIKLLSEYECSIRNTDFYLIYKFSLDPLCLNKSISDYLDFSKVKEKYLSIECQNVSFIEVFSLNFVTHF
jgi:hypothetical protein